MSGECYRDQNVQMENNLFNIKNRKMSELTQLANTTSDNDNLEQLLKYEAVVSSAEDKCTQLKKRLDKIKQLYAHKSQANADLKSLRRRTASFVDSTKRNKFSVVKPFKTVRQNSQAIGTDTSDGPLGTINNILTGITQPIKLSKSFHPMKYDNKAVSRTDTEKSCQEQLRGVEEVKINSKPSSVLKPKTKFSAKRTKSKDVINSTRSFKKVKKPLPKVTSDKRCLKIHSSTHIHNVTAPLLSKKSRKSIKLRPSSATAPKIVLTPISRNIKKNTTDLVEIYHNDAVKESRSSESNITKKIVPKIDEPLPVIAVVPPLALTEVDTQIEEPKMTITCISKNYTMPTISSRMKRVAKYYMNTFNIRCIPFCLSTSTSPSHNIGINIQQVMSMVKSKQLGKLSPTLAYNIGLATNKSELNRMPLLLPSTASGNFYSSVQCPLSKSTINYQQMQEIAKSVPQETIEETDEADDNVADTQSFIITGPTGDFKIKNQKNPIWTNNGDDTKCTCVATKGVSFQEIVNKFNSNISKNKPNTISAAQSNMTNKRMERKGSVDEETRKASAGNIQTKEKKLKAVLEKLHDEFDRMTKKYDQLTKSIEDGTSNPEMLAELEFLDKELNSKEEEIVTVMSLYKEVLALKQQVKILKDRTSKECISVTTQQSKINGHNKAATTGLLNKLLESVQQFQIHYKAR